MPRRRARAQVWAAHTAPLAPPTLSAEVPLLIQLEREVELEVRPVARARLQEKLQQIDGAACGPAPTCTGCGRRMKNRGRKRSSFVTRLGTMELRPVTYRCAACDGKCVRLSSDWVSKPAI